VHCDFGQHQGRHYLIIPDQFSSYLFVKEFSTDLTTDMLTETLTLIFSQFAIPRKIFSDGGLQFTSSKFLEYCQRWGISHKTLSPHHPQSNGFAEAAIKQMKKII
jgi:transposase InsO family protein